MKIKRTLRFEMIALTMVVSAISLFVFGGISWKLIYNEKLKQVDLTLESTANRLAPMLFMKFMPKGRARGVSDQAELDLEMIGENIGIIAVTKEGEIRWKNESAPTFLKVEDYSTHALDLGMMERPQGEHQRMQSPPPPMGPLRKMDNRLFPDRREPPPGGMLNDRFHHPEEHPKGGFAPPDKLVGFDSAIFESLEQGKERYRLMILPVDKGVFLFCKMEQQLLDEMSETTRAFMLALPFAVLLSGFGALFLSQKALEPVKRLSISAQSISAKGLDQRLEKRGEHSEFANLIDVYNAMLDRLEKSFSQAKRFSADAAHELNTPLTILHGYLDEAVQSAVAGSPEQERYAMLLEEVTTLRDIVEKLLMLSRADGGRLKVGKTEVSFSSIVSGVAEDAEIMADHLKFTASIEPSLRVLGDGNLLRQMILNLVSNAIKYNREGGAVDLILRSSDSRICLAVTNTGPRIPDAGVERLFERFFRADASRNRSRKGLGLGLSLAQEIALAHGGELKLAENKEDQITFEFLIDKAAC